MVHERKHGINSRKTYESADCRRCTSVIQNFEIGDKVHIVVEPSIQKGMPHRRFHGKTGTVLGQRGRAWMLTIRDGNADKIVISRPQHLKAQK